MRQSLVRLNIVALTLCAVLLRGLLPAGWMPDSSGAHAGFVICTAEGARHAGPQNTPAPHDPSSKHDNAICPFASSAHFAAIQNPPQLTARQAEFETAPSISRWITLQKHQRDHDHPARAPPFLV